MQVTRFLYRHYINTGILGASGLFNNAANIQVLKKIMTSRNNITLLGMNIHKYFDFLVYLSVITLQINFVTYSPIYFINDALMGRKQDFSY